MQRKYHLTFSRLYHIKLLYFRRVLVTFLLKCCLKLNVERESEKNEETLHFGHKNHRSVAPRPASDLSRLI